MQERPNRATTGTASLDAIAPIAAFLVANRLGGLRWAVAMATAASLAVTVNRRRNGVPLGTFLPILTVLIIGRGVIGVITGSEDVYFGLGIAGKLAFGVLLLVSALTARSAAARLADIALEAPESAKTTETWRSTMAQISIIGGLYYLCSGAFDVWLYQRSSVEGYVVVRFLANWPLSVAALAGAFVIAQRRLPSIDGIDSVAAMIEQRWTPAAEQQK